MNPIITIGRGNNRVVLESPLADRKDKVQREKDVDQLKNFICRPAMFAAANNAGRRV